MAHLLKLTNPSNLKRISLFFPKKCLESSKIPIRSHFHAPFVKPRHPGYQRALHALEPFFSHRVPHIPLNNKIFLLKEQYLNCLRSFCSGRTPRDIQISYHNPNAVSEAQAALCEYLHSTRGIYFTDAEHFSRNCPIFVGRILEKVKNEEDIQRAFRRFLRYQPINEFEPFFESIGLKPSEYIPLLPRDWMFLSDAHELLNNYHDLCNYGIARNKIGKMYKEAPYIFKNGPGLLKSRILAYEQLSLSKSTVIKLVASAPALLLGNVDGELVQLLKMLEEIGLPRNWIGGSLSEKNTYHWGKMLVLVHFFKDMGFTGKEVGILISKHPGFLLDGSGKNVFSVISLLLKMGVQTKEIFFMFSDFPHLQVGSFSRNLWRAFQFLLEIEMDSEDIKKLIRYHKGTFGLICLKKPNSVCTDLNIGKKRLCKIIIEDPYQLQKYVLGLKLSRLPSCKTNMKSLLEKKKFLSRLGFVENSKEMMKALEEFRGKGDELQYRFDFLVKRGLDPSDVLQMMKKAPHILNQKIEVLEEKISFIVNGLGCPLSSVVAFPQCLAYTTQRVKLRYLMYDWLKQRGRASEESALSSLIACSDKVFTKRFVSHDPEGPEAWEKLKKASSSC